MKNDKKKYYCMECNWETPQEFMDKLINEGYIICEKCGFQIPYLNKNSKNYQISNYNNEFRELIQKSLNFAKNNIAKPLKEKFEKCKNSKK
jgi:DNA-directed RNA polymerase subunit RPC12/RpoP